MKTSLSSLTITNNEIAQEQSQEQIFEGLFSLFVTQKTSSAKIVMQTFNNQIRTDNLPNMVGLLKLHLPNVLYTKCYNEENLPFIIEVRNTEIGHLFEHILLEYLCQLKIAKGFDEAVYSGRTRWNWVRDPRGKFHISLDCGKKDEDILPTAIEKTVDLMKILLKGENHLPLLTKAMKKNGLKNGKRTKIKIKSQKSK